MEEQGISLVRRSKSCAEDQGLCSFPESEDLAI